MNYQWVIMLYVNSGFEAANMHQAKKVKRFLGLHDAQCVML